MKSNKVCLIGNYKFKNIKDIFHFDFFKNFLETNLDVDCVIIKNPDIKSQIEETIQYKSNKINILTTNKINNKITKNFLLNKKPDICVYGGGRDIFSKEILKIPRFGVIGCHFGELPYFKGLDTVEWTIYYNKNLYVSIHQFDEEIDNGPIYLKEKIEYKKLKTFNDVRNSCNLKCMQILPKVTQKILNNEIFKSNNDKSFERYYRMHDKIKILAKKNLF